MHPLKAHRQRYRIRQKDLALRSGVAQATISHIETGKANPGMVVRRKLLEALSIPLRWHKEFFGEVPRITKRRRVIGAA